VARQPLGDPLLDPPLGVLDDTALCGAADDRLERRARDHRLAEIRIEDLPVAAVAEHQPIAGVVESEALGDTLDRIHQALPRAGDLA
jgi:hypothetical protein